MNSSKRARSDSNASDDLIVEGHVVPRVHKPTAGGIRRNRDSSPRRERRIAKLKRSVLLIDAYAGQLIEKLSEGTIEDEVRDMIRDLKRACDSGLEARDYLDHVDTLDEINDHFYTDWSKSLVCDECSKVLKQGTRRRKDHSPDPSSSSDGW